VGSKAGERGVLALAFSLPDLYNRDEANGNPKQGDTTMSATQNLPNTPRKRRISSRFRVTKHPSYRMHRYHQLDGHSCGFLGALAVVHYFDPEVPPEDVLRVVAPDPEEGCGQECVISGLKKLGITAAYRSGLGLWELHRLLVNDTPVIVTVWPKCYSCDHWTAVRGVDYKEQRVLLSNYDYLQGEDGSLPWKDFLAIWSPRGGGLVCEKV
jgi:hypothetical protein